jgi:peptidyl-Lys metalloendopeptidase
MKLMQFAKAGIALAATAASLSAAAAPHGVTVAVAPDKTHLGAADDVTVKVTFTNTSAEPQLVLKWATPFAGADTAPLFEVTRDGEPVTYRGAIYKRVAPTARDYFLLKPGHSYSARVELSALYDMRVTGDYTVRFHSGSAHLYGNGGGAALAAGTGGELASASASLWIDGSYPRGTTLGEPMTLSAKRGGGGGGGSGSTSFASCSSSRQSSILSARSAALNYANNAKSYLTAGNTGSRYTKWFGSYDASRYSTVKSHFTNIQSAWASADVTVDCSCTDSGTYAYVYPTRPYKIYVCGAFWKAPTTGTDSKGGTFIHEMSHFNVVASTNDWVYGQSGAASLAISDPSKAIDNADSHEYFSENNPALQ